MSTAKSNKVRLVCAVCNREFFRWPSMAKAKRPVCGVACRTAVLTKGKQEKYNAMVIRKPDGCWGWRGQKHEFGYGIAGNISAHRLSYELHVGTIPDGLFVLHKCDNPVCSNPDHLFLGTQTDNMADMKAKMRSSMGESHCHSKLTDQQVKEIRRRYAEGNTTYEKLGQEYGLTGSPVRDIVKRRTWRHI